MNEPIVVLGMHRSGTSFLVRALNLLGLWLGNEEQLYTVEGRAGIGNPKGNYEHLASVSINNDILANSGGAWDKPPQDLVVSPGHLIQMQHVAEDLEKGMPASFRRWGWKDPRTVLTLEVWSKALNRNLNLIATFRHPRAVAASLYARDGIPLETGYALWAAYNQRLLVHLHQYPSLLVRFDVEKDLLLEQVMQVGAQLGIHTGNTEILKWYDSRLVRNGTVVDDHSHHFNAVAHIWEALLNFYIRQQKL